MQILLLEPGDSWRPVGGRYCMEGGDDFVFSKSLSPVYLDFCFSVFTPAAGSSADCLVCSFIAFSGCLNLS